MKNLMITIPEPCHENWDNMSATDKGRFCNACAKEVVDFSEMSDAEILNYFSTLATANVCGRVYSDQLERTIAIPEPIKRRQFWYWNYITMFFLFFSKSVTTKAQGKVKASCETKQNTLRANSSIKLRSAGTPKSETRIRAMGGIGGYAAVNNSSMYVVDGAIVPSVNNISNNDIENVSVLQGPAAAALFGPDGANGAIVITTKKTAEKIFAGKVKDKEGRAIAFASIQKSGREGLSADAEGCFKIKCKIGDVLKISAAGFTGVSVQLTNTNLDSIVLEKGVVETLPAIIVYANTSHVVGRLKSVRFKKVTIADTIRIIKNDLLNNISIYPNPVVRGGAITVLSKMNMPGNNLVRIVNSGGALVFQEAVIIMKDKNKIIPIAQQWSTGIYYLSIFDDKGKVVAKKSFIVN